MYIHIYIERDRFHSLSLSVSGQLDRSHERSLKTIPTRPVYFVRVNPAPFIFPLGWPLQDIRSLQSFLALVNHPCIAPSICIAHTISIRLHN